MSRRLALHFCAPGQDAPAPTADVNVSHYLAVDVNSLPSTAR